MDDLGLGQGPNIVLQLAEKSSLVHGDELFFDNLFTSFDLLEKLSERGLGGTGTVRQNRLNRVPIVKKKELEKTVGRGTFQTMFNKSLLPGKITRQFTWDPTSTGWTLFLPAATSTGWRGRRFKCMCLLLFKGTTVEWVEWISLKILSPATGYRLGTLKNSSLII